MEAKLIKIDRNGSKHYEGKVTCDRCGGDGIYKWGAVIYDGFNSVPRTQYAGTCFKCDGKGWVIDKWIERTPEYQAKLDAKREAKAQAMAEQRKAWEAEQEAQRLAKEAEEKARKAKSQYVGEVGERINMVLTYEGSASWQASKYYGYGTETNYIHRFRDTDGNLIVWKTTNSLGWDVEGDRENHYAIDNGKFIAWCTPEEGDTVTVKGTIKAHTEYRDEKQTVLTRCKVGA